MCLALCLRASPQSNLFVLLEERIDFFLGGGVAGNGGDQLAPPIACCSGEVDFCVVRVLGVSCGGVDLGWLVATFLLRNVRESVEM